MAARNAVEGEGAGWRGVEEARKHFQLHGARESFVLRQYTQCFQNRQYFPNVLHIFLSAVIIGRCPLPRSLATAAFLVFVPCEEVGSVGLFLASD